MSGRAIGTVVGAVIGFYVGGPQGAYYGAMIGGMAGGLIDPETLQGAQFSGRSIAGSESGLARAIIFGTAPCDGRLMDGEAEPRVTRADVGKGGPEVENDTALLSYAIEICESSELRGTKVEAVIAVWEDEKLVYDVRENPLVTPADNAKWLANKRFWYGEEGQAPSAMLESIHGAGNVPAYVGTCRMDVEDEDLVLHGERIPRYRFLVSRCPVEPPNYLLVTGSAIDEGGPLLAAARAQSPLSFTGIPQSSGGTIAGGTPAYYGGKWVVHSMTGSVGQFSVDNRQTWTPFTTDRASTGYLAAGPDGLLVNGQGSASAYDKLGLASNIGDAVSTLEFGTEYPPGTPLKAFGQGNEAYMCCYSGGYYWIDTGAQGRLIRATDLSLATQQVVYKRTGFEHIFLQVEVHGGTAYAVTAAGKLISSPDLGATWVTVLDIGAGAGMPLYLKSGNGKLLILSRDSSTVWTSVDGFSTGHSTGIAGNAGANPPIIAAWGRGPMMAYTGENFYIISSANTETPALGDMGVMTADGIFFEEPAPLPVRGATGIAAGAAATPAGGGIIIPDAPGYEIDPITGEIVGPASDVGNACGMYLDEVVRSLYALGSQQLTDNEFDLDVLAQYYVRGYSVADVGATSADAIEPLRRTYFFDLPEYDGKIHARLRGGDIDWIIDPDDIIPGEESTLEGKRGQETSYPKRLEFNYVAISLDYKPSMQPADDINPDTFTNSIESYQTNLCLEDDEAAKIADVMLKVMRTEREGEDKFTLPIQYVGIIASDLLSIEGRRYRVDQLRTERNRVVIERAVYDRASAYYSEAVGVEGIRPPPPVSSVRGPTASAVMNMPVLRDEDDRAGVYWAAAGYLPGFRGATLYMSRNGVDFEIGPEIPKTSTMGLLTADLPEASRYAQDNTNTLRVRMYPGGKDLDSTTYEGLIEEVNVAAIVYPNGTTEIIQFQTAVETADREYELTGLMRGRQDTSPGLHLRGAQFVLLDDDVRFVAIRPDDVGKTLTFRAVSRGTNPEDNATQTITFTTIESLREWQPYNVVVTPDGLGGFCVEWIGRARLGSSRTPIHSQWFDGYRVTFTIGTVVYTVDTTAQAACLDAAAMLAEFGEGYGAPQVAVRARSKVATNDDDFDSDPVPAPGTGYEGEPIAFSGSFPDAYVGIPYILYNGDNGIAVSGGGYDANAYGFIVPGVLVSGDNALSAGFRAIGIPHTAGTLDCNVHIDGTSSTGAPWTGEIDIVQSVTTAAKPAYSPIDLTFRQASGATLVATTPPWSTFDLTSSFSLCSYGFTAADRVCEFTLGAHTNHLWVGVNAAKGARTPADSSIAVGYLMANGFAVQTTGPGVYRVECNSSGGVEVFKNGVSIATGSAGALSGGRLYRFCCTNEYVQDVQVKCNFGIDTWATTPTGGFTGVPTPTITIPCGLEAPSPNITAMMMTGDGYRGVYRGYKRNTGDNHVAMGGLGKSSGQWRVALGGGQRQGICVASYDRADGLLGAPGTADSVGWNGSTLYWCLSGVAGSVPLPMPPGALVPTWALDADADTLRVCADAVGGVVVLHTLSLPAGLTWFPAENDAFPSCTINYNPAGPAGYSDWTLTV